MAKLAPQHARQLRPRPRQIKDDDLIAGTHGRGFLILDNLTPLRQIAGGQNAAKLNDQSAHLYPTQRALRIRGNMNPPTPWPPDMATGENPPDGAMIDYYLGPNISGIVTLEVLDTRGEIVSRYNSNDPVPPLDPRYPVPTLWARPPRVLSAAPGHPSLSLGHALPRGPRHEHGPRRRPSRALRHTFGRELALGVARPLHSTAYRGRQNLKRAASSSRWIRA